MTYRCGPDVTEWLEVEIDNWVNHINGKAWLPFNLDSMARDGADMKYYSWNIIFFSRSCPESCPGTVTLAGMCVDQSELGNLVYGAVMGATGWADALTDGIARYLPGFGDYSEADEAAVGAGAGYGDQIGSLSLEDFLKGLSMSEKMSLESGAPPLCVSCPESVHPSAPHYKFPGGDPVAPPLVGDPHVPGAGIPIGPGPMSGPQVQY
jgi:hypothetical protein